MQVQTPALMALIQSAKTTAALLMSLSKADWLPTVKMFTSRLFSFQSEKISNPDRDSDAVQINSHTPYRPHTSSPTGLLICPPTSKLSVSPQIKNSKFSTDPFKKPIHNLSSDIISMKSPCLSCPEPDDAETCDNCCLRNHGDYSVSVKLPTAIGVLDYV